MTKCLQSLVIIALLASALTGCAAKRDHYDVPAVDLPKQYANLPASDTVAEAGNTPASPSLAPVLSSAFSTALTEWWRLLGSDELNDLMDRALANNPDLRIATLRIAQSKARLDQASGAKLPVITMPMQMSTTFPEFGVGRGNANGINTSRPLNQLSLKGDWRADIWGETSSMYESAELQLLRATFQRDDMQRNVVANVALAYIEYLSLNDRIKVARETEKSLEEMLASVQARLKVGDATITEMEQQKAAVYSVKSTFPVLAQQREIILNRLASLLGASPVALKLSHNGFDSVKFPTVLPGVPSALLLRRPDVRAAESRLLAADADIDVARARVLPPLDLTAQAGYGSMYMSQLFMPQALFWNTIANLSVTIFDGGKRSKEVEFAQSVHEELVETYVRVIYDAVREVDDSLSAITFMGKRLDDQSVATDSSLRAWNYSQEVFMAGAVDYLALLDTQRTYQRNMDDWHSVRLERFRALVNLFSALGGGVPSSDVIPGEGLRPMPLADEIDYGAVLSDADSLQKTSLVTGKSRKTANKAGTHFMKAAQNLVFAARQNNRAVADKVDWAGESLPKDGDYWLVEITGMYDRGAVFPAWRDLNARFPRQIENHTLLPLRQGMVTVADKERTSWYRLYVASFPDEKAAEQFCAGLRGQQSCSAVSAASIKGKGEFVAPANRKAAEKSAASTTQTAPPMNEQSAATDTANVPLQMAALPEAAPAEPKNTPATTPSGKDQTNGLDWSSQDFWLVVMSDTHERSAIPGAWKNLLTRFPAQLKDKTILPRRQFHMNSLNGASLYQLYIAKFPKKETAEEFCAMLRTNQQACAVAASQSLAEKATPAMAESRSAQTASGRQP